VRLTTSRYGGNDRAIAAFLQVDAETEYHLPPDAVSEWLLSLAPGNAKGNANLARDYTGQGNEMHRG